ncbi:MAG: LTA synthase family protein [Ezakiella sp.]|nr:LTA synthase family protein [Ezakiella sp.]
MILALLILIKFFYFYNKVHVQRNYLYTVLLSSLIALLALVGLNSIQSTINFNPWIVLYYLISIIMLIDVIYYKYFNQLTSVNLLKQITQLTTVGDSLTELFEPSQLILVLDLIIIPFLPKKVLDFVISGLDFRVIFLITVLFIMELMYFNKSKEIARQELFIYHSRDIAYSIGREQLELENSFTKEDLEGRNLKSNKDDIYHGIARGNNLILVQVEALQNFVINREYNGYEITPNLNKLIDRNNSIYFDHAFESIGRGNTSDAEYAVLTGLIPPPNNISYLEYTNKAYHSLAHYFKSMGYTTAVCHGNDARYYNRDKMYKTLGFDHYFNKDDYPFDEKTQIGFGISDEDFLIQTVEKLLQIERKGKFMSFIITLSSHTPFLMPEDKVAIKLKKEDENTMSGRYLQAINYADMALGKFIEKLEETGLLERSTLVLYGDHFAISAGNHEDALHAAVQFDMKHGYFYDDMMNIPLIICSNGLNKETISSTCSQVDIYPTIFNLFGGKNSKSIVFGSDIINNPSELAIPAGYVNLGSFIYKDVFVEMDQGGKLENSRAYKLFTHEPVDPKSLHEIYKKALHERALARYAVLTNQVKL